MTKRIFLLFAAMASALLISACKSNEPSSGQTSHIEFLEGQDTYPTFTSQGGTVRILFNAGSAWTAAPTNERASDWLRISPAKGDGGDAFIDIEVAPNEEYDERSAGIQIKSGTASIHVSVSQKQKDAINLTRSKYELDATATVLHLEYNSNIEVSFNTDASWIKPVGTKLYSAHSQDFSIEENEGFSRRDATIELSGGGLKETVYIYQAGAEPSIILPGKDLEISAKEQDFFVDVNSNVSVKMTLPDGCPWIREVKTKSMSTDRYCFSVSHNDGEDRTAEISFTNAENGLCEILTLIQHREGSISIKNRHLTILEEEQTLVIYVAADVPYSFKLDSNWITYADTASIQNYLRFYFQVQALPSNIQDRSARIIFENPLYDLSDTVKVFQTRDHSPSIAFKDAEVKRICVEKWDRNGDGELSETEAATVTQLGSAFSNNETIRSFDELALFSSLEEIDWLAFVECRNLESVSFPEHLQAISQDAFSGCIKLAGALVLPDSITSIGDNAFENCSSLVSLHLPDKLEYLGEYAFNNCTSIKGSLVIPERITAIHTGTFQHVPFDGTLTLPPNLKTIALVAFVDAQFTGSVEFPATMEYFGPSCFHGSRFETITLNSIYPPVCNYSSFQDLDCLFYVPEGTVDAYRTAPCWRSFRKKITTKGHQPEDYPNYKSTDYSKDAEVLTLQTASKGRGVNLIFMGDGYTDLSMSAGGQYEKDMRLGMEAIFAYEPYHSLRDRFNVYAVKVVSENDFFDDPDAARRLSKDIIENNDIIPFSETVLEYAKRVPNPYSQPPVITVLANVDHSAYRSFALTASKTYTTAWIGLPLDEDKNFWECELGLEAVAHETGGHAFAHLADEYAEKDGYYSPDDNWYEAVKNGWSANIDVTSDPSKVKWAKFISDQRYSSESIGVYEGGNLYTKGVWRPTINSHMGRNNNKTVFNAPSREAIYKRVMTLSEGDGWQYDYETFVAFDRPGEPKKY